MLNYNNNNASASPIFFCFTCVKDGKKYISKLFDSLIKQTKKNFIHYIYDDGSSEPMYNLIAEYKQKVSKLSNPYKIIYEYNPVNIGLNMATKHCISKVNLPYFIWINCDDWVDDDFFEEAEKYIIQNDDLSIFRTKIVFHFENKVTIPSNNFNMKLHLTKKNQYYSFLANNMLYSYFFVNTNHYFEVNPTNFFLDDKKIFNDYQVMSFFVSKSFKFGFIKKSVSHQFIRRNSECYSNLFSKTYLASKLPLIIGKENKELIRIKYEISVYDDSFDCELEKKNYSRVLKIFFMRKKYLKRNNLPKKFFKLRHRSNYVWCLYLLFSYFKQVFLF